MRDHFYAVKQSVVQNIQRHLLTVLQVFNASKYENVLLCLGLCRMDRQEEERVQTACTRVGVAGPPLQLLASMCDVCIAIQIQCVLQYKLCFLGCFYN